MTFVASTIVLPACSSTVSGSGPSHSLRPIGRWVVAATFEVNRE